DERVGAEEAEGERPRCLVDAEEDRPARAAQRRRALQGIPGAVRVEAGSPEGERVDPAEAPHRRVHVTAEEDLGEERRPLLAVGGELDHDLADEIDGALEPEPFGAEELLDLGGEQVTEADGAFVRSSLVVQSESVHRRERTAPSTPATGMG